MERSRKRGGPEKDLERFSAVSVVALGTGVARR
jgi:hypothetical protein